MSILGRTWRKSSYSNSKGGDCVEVADTRDHGTAVRDTQNRQHGHMTFDRAAWSAFLRAVKADTL